MARVRIGISGFRYANWRGVFYPRGLPQRAELTFAAQRFDSIELNGSFYALQRPETYRAFHAQTPRGFVFAVKGSRFITHMKRLHAVDQALANFFASGVLALEDKLGPVLWQFPEKMPSDLARYEAFFRALPRTSTQAATLARACAPFMRGRMLAQTQRERRLRYAVEVRNPQCATPEFVALLRTHRIALVIADTAQRFPYCEDVTTDFVYVRLHGAQELYASAYGQRQLAAWAKRIEAWQHGHEPDDAVRIAGPAKPRAGRDVYVYFDNDAQVHAPFDAMTLRRQLGLPGSKPA